MNFQDVLQRRRERLFGPRAGPGQNLRGVEFGPLSRPLVGKAESEVYYVDYCDADELKAKYADVSEAHVNDIVEVDFVSKGEPLAELVGEKAPLDYVVASHVIEHVPDLAGWLMDMHASLREGGTLYLVVPDKRFTFDLHRRCTGYEEVKAAFHEHRKRPGLRLVLDHFANVVNVDTFALWDDYSIASDAPFAHGPEFLDIAHQHYHEGRYIDIHCWVFTPWSFMHLMGQISERIGCDFMVSHFMTTQPHDLEFYVALKKSDARTDWRKYETMAREGALWPEGGIPGVEEIFSKSVA
jgi:SAM-dependent methyltransferase